MSTENLVCPECGHDTFVQTRYVQAEFTVNVNAYGIEDIAEQTLSSGDKDESDITCEECGESWPHDTDELVTAAEFERLQSDEDEDEGDDAADEAEDELAVS